MTFQIHALPKENFADLFALSEKELAKRNACREIVKSKPSTPCRVSLADAEVGETVILVNYQHQRENSPYKASNAIFVREGVEQAMLKANTVPDVIATRLISVRLFNTIHMMIDADVVEGIHLSQIINDAFLNNEVAYLHLHYAKPGCFAAKVTRQ